VTKLILTGDVNLMNVTDPTVPFTRVVETFHTADFVFSNLECCLYQPATKHSVSNEGFFANPDVAGAALKLAKIGAVGIANNVNYGDAAITASVARLDELNIAHTGAGANLAAARAPAILERNGVRIGFLQRSSVYWPTNHEARNDAPGIAVIRGHTAYHVPMFKTRPEVPPPNRPGLPPDIITWADPAYLADFRDDIAALRTKVEVVVASCHWGLGKEVLQYMREIAHAAVDAGAHIVVGHGPHYSLPIEVYKGRPIFYGLGSFSFHTGHGGRKHGDWVGMMATIALNGSSVAGASFQFVRHNDANETVPRRMSDETETFGEIALSSAKFGTKLIEGDDCAHVVLG
jgi:poly-gamma-glutamate capsule biosynthesis protein CapA/YwtB (metallophosphatase superfamily)